MDLQNAVALCVDTVPQTYNNLSCSPCRPDNKRCFQSKEKAFALNYVPNAVIQYDRNRTIIWANKAASVLSDLSFKQLVGGHNCQSAFGYSCDCQCPVERAFECSQECTAEIKTINDRMFTITALPFLDADGEVESVIEIIKDQTEGDIVENILSSNNSEVMAFSKKLSSLTDRECEVLSLVVQGKSNKIMSQALSISPKTIEIHRSRVMKKLDVDSLAKLVQLFTLYDFFNQHVPFALQ